MLVGLTMLLTNCSKEETTDPAVAPEIEPKQMTLGARIAELDESRTTLDEFKQVVWHEGDKIGLYVDDNAAQYEFTLSSDAYKTEGVFTGEGMTGAKYYAYYPYSASEANMTSGKMLTVPLATMQKYVDGSFAKGSNPMVAVGTDPQALVFQNLCGVMKLQLTGDAVVRSITVESLSASGDEGKFLSGRGNIYADTEALTNSSYTFGSTSSFYRFNYVKLTGIDVQLDRTTPKAFYLVIPAGDYNATGGSMRFTIETDKGTMFKESKTQFTINRSKIRSFAAFEAVPTGVEMATAIFYGTANCVEMMPEQTFAEVDCTPYYTCSENFTYATASDASLTKAASAKVLWCDTKENLVTVDLDAAAQKIRVTKAAGDTGNAVVAICDDAGAILWSFHIWAHAAYADKRAVAGDGTLYAMMDLNLGAVSNARDASAAGLYYQWGRKDPFPGIGSDGTSAPTYGEAWPTDAGTGTMAYAVQHPMTLITAGQYFWFADHSSNSVSIGFWGNPYTGSMANPLSTKGGKTVYDPCPAGYRVAPDNFFVNAAKSGTFDMGWTITVGDGEASFFPVAGRRASVSAVENVGVSGYYLGNALKTSGSSWLRYFYFNAADLEYDGNSIGKKALSVRCVKEQ